MKILKNTPALIYISEFNAYLRPVAEFTTEEGNFKYYDVEAAPRNRVQMFTVLEDPDGWIIRNAFLPEKIQRQGIATEFYKLMNIKSFRATGKKLRSTQPRKLHTGEVVLELSRDALAFWNYLVSLDYAKKHDNGTYSMLT